MKTVIKEPNLNPFGWLMFGIGLVLALFLHSCSVIDYMKKNCAIETQVSGKSFICFVCDFNNVSPDVKAKIERRLLETPKDSIR